MLPILPHTSFLPSNKCNPSSVSIKHLLCSVTPPDSRIRPHQPHTKDPRTDDSDERERRVGRHGSQIFRSIRSWIEVLFGDTSVCIQLQRPNQGPIVQLTYGSIDKTGISKHIDNTQSGSLLLTRLAQRSGNPAKDDGIDGVAAAGEQKTGDIARGCVHGDARGNEADHSDRHAARDVPCALVELAGAKACEDAGQGGDQVGRAG